MTQLTAQAAGAVPQADGDVAAVEAWLKSYDAAFNAKDLERLAAFHLNDSKKELNSRIDRHEHIGKGQLGIEAFRLLLNDRRFWGLPMCLETPKGPDLKEDKVNLRLLRGLIKRRQAVTRSL